VKTHTIFLHLQDRIMPRIKIFAIYVVFDLLIVAGVLFCVFQRMPVGKYLLPAIVLFALNGVWLVVMTVRNTPGSS
jgi:hypothetical protein